MKSKYYLDNLLLSVNPSKKIDTITILVLDYQIRFLKYNLDLTV